MRIILVTFCSLIACLIIFWTVKFWGRSLSFVPYSHPLFTFVKLNNEPIVFLKPTPEGLASAIDSSENLYLDIASTIDQKVVIPLKDWTKNRKPLRYSQYTDVASDVVLLVDVKDKLAGRKLIFNLFENAQAGHAIFFDELKKMGWEKGENIIVTSPYEAMAKALKDIAPTLLYGSTQPEILRLVAMKSMHLIEAVSFRADIVIHPLQIKKQSFYDKDLLTELSRRHKRIIIGPLNAVDVSAARQLNPMGIIITP